MVQGAGCRVQGAGRGVRGTAVRPQRPFYLRVSPGHPKHWNEHCPESKACVKPVYFVRQEWFPEHYSHRDEDWQGDDDRGHDRGHGTGHGKDKGRDRDKDRDKDCH